MLIDDIEYVIFRHPDLAHIREFMLSYGLLDLVTRSRRQGHTLTDRLDQLAQEKDHLADPHARLPPRVFRFQLLQCVREKENG